MCENVTAIIPAYNEAQNILETINAVKHIDFISEIIVVDDGSKDGTYERVKNLEGIILIQNRKNKGKGAAIKAALPYISNTFVIFIDADLRDSAIELHKLVSNTKRSSKTMLVAVYPQSKTKGGFGLVKGLSKRGMKLLASKSNDSILSGQRLLSTGFIRNISIPDNFGIEFKLTLEAYRNNIEIIEIPVNIRHRETGRSISGFIHRGKQFANILYVLIREMI